MNIIKICVLGVALLFYSSCRKSESVKLVDDTTETVVDWGYGLNNKSPIRLVHSFKYNESLSTIPTPSFYPYDEIKVSMPASTRIVDTLRPSGLSDYANMLEEKLTLLARTEGGGVLYVEPGVYPLARKVDVLFSENMNASVSSPIFILGLEKVDNDGNIQLPLFVDSNISSTPHSFFSFDGIPEGRLKAIFIDRLKFRGNNPPFGSNHPFVGNASLNFTPAISFNNMDVVEVKNVEVQNQYGDGINIANWTGDQLNDYNLGERYEIDNVYIKDCWSHSGNIDSGVGMMFRHARNVTVKNSVVSNHFNRSKVYGLIGIVFEMGSVGGTLTNNFIQGYREGIKFELDKGGHEISENLIGKNKIAGITYGHDQSMINTTGTGQFQSNLILGNIFVYGQKKNEFGANHSTFIYTPGYLGATEGTQVKHNTFYFHQDPKIEMDDPLRSLDNQYNIYIQINQQPNWIIEDNLYL